MWRLNKRFSIIHRSKKKSQEKILNILTKRQLKPNSSKFVGCGESNDSREIYITECIYQKRRKL